MHNGQTINDLWDMTEKFFRADVQKRREQVSSGGVHAGRVNTGEPARPVYEQHSRAMFAVRQSGPLEKEAAEIAERERKSLENRMGLEGDYGDSPQD